MIEHPRGNPRGLIEASGLIHRIGDAAGSRSIRGVIPAASLKQDGKSPGDTLRDALHPRGNPRGLIEAGAAGSIR